MLNHYLSILLLSPPSHINAYTYTYTTITPFQFQFNLGVDRCGKTTQCSLLLKHLISLSVAAVALRFPDRTTNVGQLIDGYLCNSETNVDDRAIHLLFSANRWEVAPDLAQMLADGKTVVCDRYAYSGVAFSSAKIQEDRQSEGEDMTIDWCKAPDVGLPAPDAVIFLDLSQGILR